jgi:RNA polymerase sigma-70 factor (ECF subfamily)
MEPRPDLVRLAQSGDTLAARSLIEKNYPAVYRLVLSILDDPVEAEQAARAAGTAQLDLLDAYPGPEGYTAWLYRLTMQVCLRRLRARKMEGWLQRFTHGGVEARPDKPAEAGETERLVRAAARLDEGLRLVLVLRYGHDLLPHEIGQVLNWRESSVQAGLFQARQKLRSILNIPVSFAGRDGAQSDLTHRQAERLIESAADHAITDADAARLARHLKDCPRCVEAARRLEGLENELRAAFHARWMAIEPPEAGRVATSLDQRRRRRARLRSLSLGGGLVFSLLVVGLIVFLPTLYPAQSAARPTAVKSTPTTDATPTEADQSPHPVNNRGLLAGIYPGKLAFIAFSSQSDHLFTFQPGSRDFHQFTAGLSDDSFPAWSPDGRLVAYLTTPDTGGPNQLYVADANGNHIRPIPGPDFSGWMTPTQDPVNPQDDIYPHYGPAHWSPDGQWLATAVWATSGRHFMVVQNIGGDSAPRLVPVQDIHPNFVAWSPDGSTIAYLCNDEKEIDIWKPGLPTVAGVNPRMLYYDDAWSDFFGLAWSPDSSQVAALGGLRETDIMQVDLFFINMKGESPQQMPISAGILTRTSLRQSDMIWSPDGRYLAFIPVFTNSDLVYGRILLIRTGAVSPLPPLAEMDWQITSFAWSPDGKWLAYSAGYEMWVASIDAFEAGQAPLARLSGSPGSDLSWQPLSKEQ